MAMTPDEKLEFEQLKSTVDAIQRADDVSFVTNILRRVDLKGFIKQTRIGDLANVNDANITNGQVLKFASSTGSYTPADDNT